MFIKNNMFSLQNLALHPSKYESATNTKWQLAYCQVTGNTHQGLGSCQKPPLVDCNIYSIWNANEMDCAKTVKMDGRVPVFIALSVHTYLHI
jgi:hypothetical protein